MATLTLACVVFVTAAVRYCADDPITERIRSLPGAVERLRETDRGAAASHQASPLIVQAQALAAYLNPPASPPETPAPKSVLRAARPRPVAAAAELRLYATSCYPDEPDRSMALVLDAGSPAAEQQWVKEGGQCGSFIIHEIRRGAVVYRRGEQVYEVALQTEAALPSIVRDPRHGSRPVSRAGGGMTWSLAGAAEPNGVRVSHD